ncbi:MAG: MFS transporter [Desulfosarcinaceae bacterium]|nr:MFS transporter [Desulfosarcinaceae bacterium]
MPHLRSHDDSPQAQRNPIAFLTAIFFLSMLSRLGMAPLLPAIESDLGLNHAQAGGLFLYISAGYGAGLFGSILLTPRFSHRNLIIASCLAVGLCLMLAAVSQGRQLLRLSLMVLGLAGGIYLPSGVATLTALVRKADWGKVLGFHQLAPNLAYIVAPLAAEAVLAWRSWRSVLLLYAAASLLLSLGYALWGRGVDRRGSPAQSSSLAAVVRRPAIWWITALFILGMGLNQGVFAVMPLYLNFERELAPGWSNLVLALSRVAAFAVPLAGGWLADRYGVGRVMFATLLCAALGTFATVWLSNPWLWVALILQACASVSIFPLCFAMIALVTGPETRSVAVSVVVPVAHLLGAGMVPLGIGLLAEAGRFDLGFVALAVMTLLTLPGVLLYAKQ